MGARNPLRRQLSLTGIAFLRKSFDSIEAAGGRSPQHATERSEQRRNKKRIRETVKLQCKS